MANTFRNVIAKNTYYRDENGIFWSSGEQVHKFDIHNNYICDCVIVGFFIRNHSVTKEKIVYFNFSNVGKKQKTTLPAKGYLGVLYRKLGKVCENV